MGHDCNGVKDKSLNVSINESIRKGTGQDLKRTRYSSLIQTVFRLSIITHGYQTTDLLFKDWEGCIVVGHVLTMMWE